jgi:hypothetical protein
MALAVTVLVFVEQETATLGIATQTMGAHRQTVSAV